jgi:O-acetyl-ADP-ribose deacetylase (regulator of RNase III)
MDPVRRPDWQHQVLQLPETIPNPPRVWTEQEMATLRGGHQPADADDKWFAFMVGERLYLHRSSTGLGVYEVQFTPADGGHAITDAVVTGDSDQYRRGPDEAESERLERLISRVLLGESMLGRDLLMHPVTPNVARSEPVGFRIEVVVGDITRQDTDAIVNAANESLLGGGGVDGAIHRAAGPELLAFNRGLGGCATGEAKVSPGFRLPATWVIHTVGPVWHGGHEGEAELLAACYRNCLARADEIGAATVAFPAISTGVYGYPVQAAAGIAVATVRATATRVRLVRFVCFDDATRAAYAAELGL